MTVSPFPGMDPFLETHWRSVHHRLITYLGDQLQSLLPSSFRVEVEERVIEIADEPITEGYLEIVDMGSGEKVVSAIELLSLSNKTPGDGNELYVRKQREYRLGKVNQIEIDLTRAGDRGLVFPMSYVPETHRATYLACVRRAAAPAKIEIYPMPLSQRLPVLSIPLTSTQADVPLDLQSAVDACYRNGRYADIDYSQPLRPAITGEDATWCVEQLRKFSTRK